MTITALAAAPIYRQALRLNSHSRESRDVKELHRTVMAGFSEYMTDGAPGERTRLNILFAANREQGRPSRKEWPPKAGTATQILLQADVTPTWTENTRRVLTPLNDPFEVQLDYQAGDEIDIALIVNATAQRLAHGKQRRIGVRTDEVAEWLQRKLQGAATVDPGLMRVSAPVRHGSRASSNITFDARSIEARAYVENPEHLAHLVRTGIGRAKAYGAGLIRVRPAH